ncbi:MAG: class I SAM-dependent methyltransferase [Bacteroidota bacterium]
MNKKIVAFLDKTFYPEMESGWDDKIFRQEILNFIGPDKVILDIGAGRGRILEMNFKDLGKKVYGVDPTNEIFENPLIDKAYVGVGDSMPFFENDYFDVVFCDNVLEHVENPEAFYKEVSRVLKKNGIFLAKTPNKYHYMPLIASFTPTSFHRFYNKLRGRDFSDTFPTFYRANSRKAYEKHAAASGLELLPLKYCSGRPEYLRIFFLTYLLGILYEKTINLLRLDSLKVVIISKMSK